MDRQRTAFGTVLFGGFHKEDVYKYIEQLVIDHKTECKRYEHQNADLQLEISRITEELTRVSAECEKLKDEKLALQAELAALKAAEEDAE